MEKSDPVRRVLERATSNDERVAVGRKQGIELTLEKKSYPKRHGGVLWKVVAYNADVREEETGLSPKTADQMFERLSDLHDLDEVEDD